MRKILGIFEVFLGVFEKTKEKKDRAFTGLCTRGRVGVKPCLLEANTVLGGSWLQKIISQRSVSPRRSNRPQWRGFASRRQGFTPTLRLVQNPANGSQNAYFVANQCLRFFYLRLRCPCIADPRNRSDFRDKRKQYCIAISG